MQGLEKAACKWTWKAKMLDVAQQIDSHLVPLDTTSNLDADLVQLL